MLCSFQVVLIQVPRIEYSRYFKTLETQPPGLYCNVAVQVNTALTFER
ncbi:MAG: hypothetical protein MUC48_14565 [Leptolyngbya sp. Prado105]|nr:hypothetical protein [Leptolyngbya sp. Prado105]